MNSTFHIPIKILSAVLTQDGFKASCDNSYYSLKWEDITHICAVIIKRSSTVYYLVFYTESEPRPYIIASDSFNYKKILDKFLNNQQQNFLEVSKIFVENAKVSFVDWPLRDVLNSGDFVTLPHFNDVAHVISYCSDMRINNKYEEQNVQDSAVYDSPSVIFTKTLEKLRTRRESLELSITKLQNKFVETADSDKESYAKMLLPDIDKILNSDKWLISAYLLKAEILRYLDRIADSLDCLMSVVDMYFEDGVNPSLYLTLAKGFRSLGLKKSESKILSDYYGLFPSRKIDISSLMKISDEKVAESGDWYRYYNYGFEMFQREEFISALEMFNQSIAAFPNFSWTYYWKAKCLKKLGKQNQSIEFFLHSGELSQNVLSLVEVAEIYEEQHRNDLAQDYYRQILTLKPYIPEVYLSLGKNILNHAKDDNACFKLLLNVIEIEPYGELAEDAFQIAESLSQISDEKKNKPLSERDDMEVGDIFDNNYLIEEIHKGGMGIVYIVKELSSSQIYALKTFQDKFLWDSSIINMFHKEAEIWVRLGIHNNIVRAVNVKNFDGKPYIFLEYIDGTDLEKIISEEKLSIGQILNFSLQFCAGMAYAYKTMGLVHQDIKPSNCMVTKDGVLKITDFGLVKIFTESSVKEDNLSLPNELISLSGPLSSSVSIARNSKIYSMILKSKSAVLSGSLKSIKRLSTISSMHTNDNRQIVGTIPYMAPEQFTGSLNSGTVTDIYSFGAMLYEMLVGIPPFGNTDFEECVFGHLEREPENPCNLRYDTPKALGEIVLRCLSKEPSERFEDFSELFSEINSVYDKLYNSSYVFGVAIKDGQDNFTDFILQGRHSCLFQSIKKPSIFLQKHLN